MGLICFDLDGTLVDPSGAMLHCATLTCREFGLEPPSLAEVAAAVGLGAGELFAAYPELRDPDRLAAALASYWAHFAEDGIVRHHIYDGVNLMLARLKRQGHRLYLVTVLPTRYARQVLHQFDLLLAFDEAFGNTLGQPWQSKGELLAHMRQQGVLVSPGYLVGDRGAELSAARDHGLVPLGVTYGFGHPEELLGAGAHQLFASVPLLDDWFKLQLPDPEQHDAFTRSE